MAPLLQALKTRYKETQPDGSTHYEGVVNPEWTIAAIPHGGYALGLILDAAIQSQSKTSQQDICHCTAHYLRSALTKPFIVKIQMLKKGRGFSNILAELIQDDSVRIMAHLIFTSLPDAPEPQLPTPTSLTLTQPSPYARVIPLETPPTTAQLSRLSAKFSFKDKFRWAEDNALIEQRNEENASQGKGGLEWFAWIHLTDPKDAFTAAGLPFCGDMFRNVPELLPRGQRAGPSWFPTMVLTLDFKVKMSSLQGHAKRTVGCWSSGRHCLDGRHDNQVEVWSAPCELGDKGELPQDWRKKQHCLVIANQMALTLPLSVNEKRRSKL